MAKAVDLFEDSSMSFGEHIEVLRRHLIRAIVWVGVAFAVTSFFFGNQVVILLTKPLEAQLKQYHLKKIAKRTTKLQLEDAQIAPGLRPTIALNLQLGDDDLRALAKALRLPELPPPPAPAAAPAAEPGAEPAAEGSAPPAVSLQAHFSTADLVRQLSEPLAQITQPWSVRSLSAQEGFVIWFKAVLGASMVLASPFVFYELYSFVAVGLYAHERRFVHLTLPFSVGLFLGGVAVCFWLVFPAMLTYFFGINEWIEIEPDVRLSEWVGFAVMLMLIFGVTFQLPLLMLMLQWVGILSHEMLASRRKVAAFVLLILAAIMSPGGDPSSFIALAVPMIGLFELGLFLMHYTRRRNPFEADDAVLAVEQGEGWRPADLR